jgi:hypothetical protein
MLTLTLGYDKDALAFATAAGFFAYTAVLGGRVPPAHALGLLNLVAGLVLVFDGAFTLDPGLHHRRL